MRIRWLNLFGRARSRRSSILPMDRQAERELAQMRAHRDARAAQDHFE